MRHQPRHYLLTPVGSAGDVHPFLGIGRELRRRGQRVTLLAAEPFRDSAQRADLDFVACWSNEYVDAVIQDPDLWHPRRGLKVIMGAVAASLRDTYGALSRLYEPGRTVLVGHTLSFATRSFEEKYEVPAATLHLAPGLLRSLRRLPAVAPGRDISGLPRPLKRAFWWLGDRIFIDPHILPALNAWRGELGLRPVRRPFQSWLHSPRATLGLFPEWFGLPQPDWPPQVRLTGFPLFDDDGAESLSPALERFLASGAPPIVFTPGSANRQAPHFFQAAIAATACLDRRAILLTRFAEQLPHRLPDSVLHVDWVSLSRLLPACAGIVHHGGIGTCAQGLAAGVPQLLMPMGFDQPDNAVRLRRLGVGDLLPPERFTARRLARKLAALIERPSVTARCRQLRGEAGSYDGIRQTCELLESLR
ncbi:MAG: glycosyltransferase [Gemmatimonadales bacterium]